MGTPPELSKLQRKYDTVKGDLRVANEMIERLRETLASVLLGTDRPPEHVFEEFRRLHGLSSRPDGGAA